MLAPRPQRVAIIHEWLVMYAGSERALGGLLSLYPDADLYALVDFLDDEDRARLYNKRAKTSFLQRMPFVRTAYRNYLPLMPMAIEQFDLSSYDLVISNSHAAAKGVITGPNQRHICYCHSPARYAWDLQHQYLSQSRLTGGIKSALARIILHYIRLWDTRTAPGVDLFVGNSAYIARRIHKVYGRPAAVVHPPVDIDAFPLRLEKEDFYLAASRMVPYKRLDLIVEAFAAMPDKKLVVIGDGPEMGRIRSLATPNVTLLGYQEGPVLRDHLQRARAFVFAAEEDFGILPVEAQACGTPVIAFGKGGALDTVIDLNNQRGAAPTGVFFGEQTTAALIDAVTRFEAATISPAACRAWAETFALHHFQDAWRRAAE